MKSEIIINVGTNETRIAIIEDSKLVEVWVERPENERMVGDIYKGIVKAVIPGIQAAFIDIGLEKSAFLHVSDVSGNTIDFAAQYEEEDEEDEEDEDSVDSGDRRNSHDKPSRDRQGRLKRGRDKRNPPIESILKQNQEIIVEVTKEPISTKGARVTSEVSLPGRFLVLFPGSNKIGISRKIESRTERKRLRQLVQKYKPKGFGLIIRTVAEGKGEKEIESEVKDLLSAYNELMRKAETMKAPALIHKEMGMTSGIIRDLLSEDVIRVLIDSKEQFSEIQLYLKNTSPNLVNRVVLYSDKEPIFDKFGIEHEIDSVFSRKAELKSGGSLVFNHTEALAVIDVNSGKFVGKSNQEETILETNIEAAQEIARQLRFRDIGGIIVIDFIDMWDKRNRAKVENTFANALRNDRSKVSISQISEFGLMEMTRQRVRPSLIYTFSESCPACGGVGMVQSRETTVSKIERWLKRADAFGKEREYTVFVNPAVFAYLIENEEERLSMLNTVTKLKYDFVVDAKIAIDEFYCFSSKRNVDVTKDFIPGGAVYSHTMQQTRSKAPEPNKSFTRPQNNGRGMFGRKPRHAVRK